MTDARANIGEGSAEGSAAPGKKRKLSEDVERSETKRPKASKSGTEETIKMDEHGAQKSGIENADSFLDSNANVAAAGKSSELRGDDEAIDSDFDPESLTNADVKSAIVDILDNSKKPSSHAVGKLDGSVPLPNLVVEGFGYVPLPMHALIAGELIKHMERSPYGHGERTITDPEYRNSYQLGPEKFKINNRKFRSAVHKIVGTVAEQLCFSADNVTAKLYKFLLYETGGLFKPHKDTEKDHGMFATLIIQLPSVFTGGQFRVVHNGKTKTFDLSQQGSDVNSFYVAHFASCTHELTRIESGYRAAVVYNLCWTGNATLLPTLSENLGVTKTIRQLIRTHLKETERKNYPGSAPGLVWLLEHDYTDESLRMHGLKALKGKDAFVVKQLMDTNEGQEEKDMFAVAVAKATKHEEGNCETHDDWDPYGRGAECKMGDCCESEVELENFTKLGDNEPACVFKRWNIDPEADVVNFDDDDDGFWGEPDRDECGGPTGNEGATMERWYSRRVLVVYFKAKERKMAFLENPGRAIKHLLQGMKSQKLTDEDKESVLACDFTSIQVPDVTLLAYKNGDMEFVKKVIVKISKTNEGFGLGSERKRQQGYHRHVTTSEQETKEDETGLSRCLKLYKSERNIADLEPYLVRMIRAIGERNGNDWERAQECLRIVDEILPTKHVYGQAIFELFFERMSYHFSQFTAGKSRYAKAIKFLMTKYPDIIPAKWETMVKSNGLCHPSEAFSLIPVFQTSNLAMKDQIIERMVVKVLEFVLPKWIESSKRTGSAYYSPNSVTTFQDEIQKLTQIVATNERLMKSFCEKFSTNARLDCVGNWIDWVFDKNIRQLMTSPRFRQVVENRINALKLQTADPIPELDSQFRTKKGEVRRSNAAQRAVEARNAKIQKRNTLISAMNKLQEKLKSMN